MIHYLYKYKIYYLKNKNYLISVNNTHETVGKAVLTTSGTVSLGFSSMFFNFVPTVIFGLFTSLAMIFAMMGY